MRTPVAITFIAGILLLMSSGLASPFSAFFDDSSNLMDQFPPEPSPPAAASIVPDREMEQGVPFVGVTPDVRAGSSQDESGDHAFADTDAYVAGQGWLSVVHLAIDESDSINGWQRSVRVNGVNANAGSGSHTTRGTSLQPTDQSTTHYAGADAADHKVAMFVGTERAYGNMSNGEAYRDLHQADLVFVEPTLDGSGLPLGIGFADADSGFQRGGSRADGSYDTIYLQAGPAAQEATFGNGTYFLAPIGDRANYSYIESSGSLGSTWWGAGESEQGSSQGCQAGQDHEPFISSFVEVGGIVDNPGVLTWRGQSVANCDGYTNQGNDSGVYVGDSHAWLVGSRSCERSTQDGTYSLPDGSSMRAHRESAQNSTTASSGVNGGPAGVHQASIGTYGESAASSFMFDGSTMNDSSQSRTVTLRADQESVSTHTGRRASSYDAALGSWQSHASEVSVEAAGHDASASRANESITDADGHSMGSQETTLVVADGRALVAFEKNSGAYGAGKRLILNDGTIAVPLP